jgi:hypothetical protein
VEKDIAGRPNDVEFLFEWTFPEDYQNNRNHDNKHVGVDNEIISHVNYEQQVIPSGNITSELGDLQSNKTVSNKEALLCGLCGLGDFNCEDEQDCNIASLGAVVTCSVCKVQHYHRYCMPMSRVALTEDQAWRCWNCTCK